MITTKITVKEHLKEYCIAKFSDFDEGSPVMFPRETDIYLLIWDRLRKRPVDCQIDRGNLEIALPNRREGKNPLYWNYLNRTAQKEVERKIERMMWAELRDAIDSARHRDGIPYIASISAWMDRYGISSISEDALRKNYYRWREKIRKKEKRPYKKHKITPT
ncbi:MAG: hypothetical protein LBR08_11220 [Bacteroidales bacterium]|jgi:hypothetical protein|nr:hypothetical protein [Bacteroidales bacterium]